MNKNIMFTIGLTAAAFLRAVAKHSTGTSFRIIHEGELEFDFDFEGRSPAIGDEVYECGGMRICVDHESIPYLMGLHLDVQRGHEGYRFILWDPDTDGTLAPQNRDDLQKEKFFE